MNNEMNQLAGTYSALFLRLKRACELHKGLNEKNSEAFTSQLFSSGVSIITLFPLKTTELNKELKEQNWNV
jgi:hypothetical protein